MITLYGAWRSRASRPLWLLAEIGAPYHHVPVIQASRLADPRAADAPVNTLSHAFLAVNPLGQIPAMEEDGLVLTESLAITSYIARSIGGALGPQSAAECALTEQWALFAVTAIETPALEILRAIEAGSESLPETRAALAVSAEKLRAPLTRLGQHLQHHAWLVGERFTVADLNTAECLRYAQGHAGLMAEFPAVSDWLARCQARPGFQHMWAERAKEPL